MNERSTQRYDAVVVGARCAGAATAMLLARRGLRVLAIDRGAYAGDTLSTHALMRPAVLQLARWGLLDRLRRAGTPPIQSTRFHYGDEVVDVPIRARDGVDALYAPRRTSLDATLVDAARQDGAEVRHGVRAIALLRDQRDRVRGLLVEDGGGRRQRIEAGVVIGADGAGSWVARAVEAESYRIGAHAASCVYGYFEGLAGGAYDWFYREGCAAGAIPTNDGLTNVFVSVSSERFRAELARDLDGGFERLLAECAPGLAEAIRGARPVHGLRAFAGHRGFLRRPWGHGWALVGDAGYFKDPLTAHGITDALRDAELCARAVAEGTPQALARYRAARDGLSLRFFELSDAIASFDWDLETLAERHRELSVEMKREAGYLLALDDAGRSGSAAA